MLLKNTIDCDKIVGELKIRTREDGDRIALVGRGCTKSLKKLFNELGIPSEQRGLLPIATDDEGIVWIHSVGIADRVKVGRETKKTATFIVNKTDKI